MPENGFQEWITDSEEATRAAAAQIAKRLREGDVVFLTGDLGAGKTAFTRGLAEALGAPDEVSSPTYTLLQSYDSRPILHHFDLYRLKDAEDVYGAGLHEFIGTGICAVEWPEPMEPFCENPIRVFIERLDGARRIRAYGLRGEGEGA